MMCTILSLVRSFLNARLRRCLRASEQIVIIKKIPIMSGGRGGFAVSVVKFWGRLDYITGLQTAPLDLSMHIFLPQYSAPLSHTIGLTQAWLSSLKISRCFIMWSLWPHKHNFTLLSLPVLTDTVNQLSCHGTKTRTHQVPEGESINNMLIRSISYHT